MFNYQPVVPKNSIYHRSGWRDVMDHLQCLHDGNAKVKFIDLVENYYSNLKNPYINCHWVGIIHHLPGVQISDSPSLEMLFNDKRFQRDLFYCQGIYTLSSYLKDYLQTHRLFKKIPIVNLYHPIQSDFALFDLQKYSDNPDKTLIFIGNQDRRYDRFIQMKTSYEKLWLSGKSYDESIQLLINAKINLTNMASINIKRVENSEYDDLLTKNIVVLDLYNSSANNTVIECLVRNTPLLVNPVGGVKEYLGEDYPLYYQTILELEQKSTDIELIRKAYHYLVEKDKSFLSFDRFLSDLKTKEPIASNIKHISTKFTKNLSINKNTNVSTIPIINKHINKPTNITNLKAKMIAALSK